MIGHAQKSDVRACSVADRCHVCELSVGRARRVWAAGHALRFAPQQMQALPAPNAQRSASHAAAQGDNLFQLLGTRFAPDAGAYMLMAACVMLPTVWLPDLKALSYLGFFGVGATITVLCAVAYTFLSGSPAFRGPVVHGGRERCLSVLGGRP